MKIPGIPEFDSQPPPSSDPLTNLPSPPQPDPSQTAPQSTSSPVSDDYFQSLPSSHSTVAVDPPHVTDFADIVLGKSGITGAVASVLNSTGGEDNHWPISGSGGGVDVALHDLIQTWTTGIKNIIENSAPPTHLAQVIGNATLSLGQPDASAESRGTMHPPSA